MSDNRMNRCENKPSPLIFRSENSELGSSEYAQAFSLDKSTSCDGDTRPVSAPILRGADSEYAKAFGPKAPYSRPGKPLWMLNKYKSGFDLKSDPDAKFDGTTIYKEAFLDTLEKPSTLLQPSKPSVVVETLFTHHHDQEKDQDGCESARDSGISLEINGQIGDSKFKGSGITSTDSEAIAKNEGESNTVDDSHLRLKLGSKETDAKIVYSFLDGTKPSSHGEKEPDQDVKILAPRPQPLPSPAPAVPPTPKSRLTTPLHGRKKVSDEPSLYATPGLRYFMNSIRR